MTPGGLHARPPGPRGHPLLGNLPAFRADPLKFLARTAREHGDVAQYRVIRVTATLASRPDLIGEVLTANVDDVHKGRVMQTLRPVMGNGLLLAEGDEWRRQRRMVQPAFRREQLRAYSVDVGASGQRAVEAWRDGETRDIGTDLRRMTLEVAARTLLGVDIGSQSDEVGVALGVFLERFDSVTRAGMLVPFRVPTPGNLRMRRAVRRLDRVLYRLIGQRRAMAHAGNDLLLGLLLRARDDDGRPPHDREIRDQVATFLLAGHATTGVALTWTVLLLAHHPDVLERVAHEAIEVAVGRSLTSDDLPHLRFSTQVVKESLRLYPPIWGIVRTAMRPLRLDGYAVPAGSSVGASQWVTHRDSRFWTNSAAFDPDRWDVERAREVPRYAYFPFGGGQRACVGQGFAMMESALMLSTIARRFSWTLAPGQDIRPWPTIVVEPRGGVRIVLRSRQPERAVAHDDC